MTTHPLAEEALLHNVPVPKAVFHAPHAFHGRQLGLLADMGIHRPAYVIVT